VIGGADPASTPIHRGCGCDGGGQKIADLKGQMQAHRDLTTSLAFD
jgi:hypothetical protein